MAFAKKNKIKLQALAIFAGVLLIFAIIWLFFARQLTQNTMAIFLHQDILGETDPNHKKLSQTFVSDSGFISLGIAPPPKTAQQFFLPKAVPEVFVYDDAGIFLGSAKGKLAQSESEDDAFFGYYIFEFGLEVQSPSGKYLLEVLPNGLSFGRTLRTPQNTQYFRDGKRGAGALGLGLSTGPIGGFLGAFFWVFAALFSLALSLVFWFANKKLPSHRLFAISATLLGLLYCFILPPYSAPDEQFHINQTFNISSAMLGKAPWQVPWGSNYKRAADADSLVEDYNITSFTYRRHARDFTSISANSATVKMQGEEVGGYRLIYFPAAFAVSLCRLLGLGFVPTLYVGRFFNLALYIFLCTKAVKLAPFGKQIFALVPILPMSLHLGASFSRDCLTIGLYMFYTALCLHYTFKKDKLCGKDLLLLFATSVLAAPAKAVYAPLLMLCLAIPPQKLHFKEKALGKKTAQATLAFVVFLGVASFFAQGGGAIVQEATAPPVQVVLRQTGGANGTGAGQISPQELAQAGYNPDAIRYSFADFYKRPFTIAQLLARTATENATFYLQTMLGGNLSYFNLPISWVFILPIGLLLFFASVPTSGQLRPKPLWQVWGGFLAVSAIGLVFIGCITWTPTYYSTIYGVQGRYFLPALPLALCAISPLWQGRLVAKPGRFAGLVFAASALALCVLANAMLVVLAR